MSDIFHEVEEEVRRERFEKLWKQYGDYIIAAVALIIIAIAGYELWTRYQENQRFKASETLIAAQALADAGDFNKANAAFATLATDAPSGYAKIARLSHAGVLLAQGQRTEALTIYKSIAADDQGPIGSLAVIRAAWILSDSAPRSEVQALLAPLLQPVKVTTYSFWIIPETKTEENPWRFSAREILAYADYHAGDAAKAAAAFKALGDDKAAPDGTLHRAAAMAVFLKNGGLSNYGTVPAPPKPPAAVAPAPTAPTGTPPK